MGLLLIPRSSSSSCRTTITEKEDAEKKKVPNEIAKMAADPNNNNYIPLDGVELLSGDDFIPLDGAKTSAALVETNGAASPDETGDDDELKMGSEDQSLACVGRGGGVVAADAIAEDDRDKDEGDLDGPLRPQKLCSDRWLGVGGCGCGVGMASTACCCGGWSETGASRFAPLKSRFRVRSAGTRRTVSTLPAG